jgi:hypothetical protein
VSAQSHQTPFDVQGFVGWNKFTRCEIGHLSRHDIVIGSLKPQTAARTAGFEDFTAAQVNLVGYFSMQVAAADIAIQVSLLT